jgi:hypothetical protein
MIFGEMETGLVARLNVVDVEAGATWYESKLGMIPDHRFDAPGWRQFNLNGVARAAVRAGCSSVSVTGFWRTSRRRSVMSVKTCWTVGNRARPTASPFFSRSSSRAVPLPSSIPDAPPARGWAGHLVLPRASFVSWAR